MKPRIKKTRLAYFGLVIGMLVISLGGVYQVEAAAVESPPLDDQLEEGLDIMPRIAGVVSPLTSVLSLPVAGSPPAAGNGPLQPGEDDDQIRAAERARIQQAAQLNRLNFMGDEGNGQIAPLLPLATNDDISAATEISVLTFTDSVDTTAATTEVVEPAYSCGYSVGATVWYSFTPPENKYYTLGTNTSDFDTVVHIFDDSSMDLISCDDNDGGLGNTSRITFYGTTDKNYLISVGGKWGGSGSLTFNLLMATGYTNCTAVDVSQAECEALVALYDTTGGSTWTRTDGWKQTAEVCSWFGITCTAGSVIWLLLPDNNLVGSLSVDFTALSNMYFLDLGINTLTGDIGALVNNFPASLWYFYLYQNGFTGTISPGFLSLNNLVLLDFTGNLLSGDLGTGLINLPTTLSSIWLGENNFTGTISSSLSSFTYLSELDLHGNLLSGDLAIAISNLPASIYFVGFRDNNFYGTIPASAASLSSLNFFDARQNFLNGEISVVFDNLPTGIESLYLSDNEFTGTIPDSIFDFTSLTNLNIANNDGLLGTISSKIVFVPLNFFNFSGTYLCESPDASYPPWKASVSGYYPGFCGYELVDLTVLGISFSPTTPAPNEAFTATVHVRNIGGESSAPVTNVDFYLDRVPACYDFGDQVFGIGSMAPGASQDVVFSYPAGLAGADYNFYAAIEIDCTQTEADESNNILGPETLRVSMLLFTDDFETGDFSLWTRFNDGNGYLYPCTEAAIHGTYGACVDRGTDKRKQLIDETPVNQTTFNVQFGFDVNSLSMGVGERFRFMQVKMGAERPFFLVMKSQGGVYQIQLNALLDDLTKVKTGWYLLTDAPHVIEVAWEAASAPAADDGSAALYLDDLLLESLTGLDNDLIYVDTFKIGFTSRLNGKAISGIFYLDDLATSRGYIGLP